MSGSHITIVSTLLRERAHAVLLASMLCVGLSAFSLSVSAADFTFAWGASGMTSIGTSPYWPQDCGTGSGNNNCDGFVGNLDVSRWTNDVVQDVNGNQYYHMIVGAPGDQFKQESYIMLSSIVLPGWNPTRTPQGPSDSGGDPTVYHNIGINGWADCTGSAFCDPLDKVNTVGFAGNGSGNPIRILLDQVLVSNAADANPTTGYAAAAGTCTGAFCQEFKKVTPVFSGTLLNANKPLITQKVNDSSQGTMSLNFKADMSAINYSTNSSPLTISNNMASAGVFVNTFSLTGVAGLPDINSADFDISKTNDSSGGGVESGKSSVTAGRYTFTPGVGQAGSNVSWFYTVATSTLAYVPGTYSYIDPLSNSFDPKAVNYSLFCNLGENPHIAGSDGC